MNVSLLTWWPLWKEWQLWNTKFWSCLVKVVLARVHSLLNFLLPGYGFPGGSPWYQYLWSKHPKKCSVWKDKRFTRVILDGLLLMLSRTLGSCQLDSCSLARMKLSYGGAPERMGLLSSSWCQLGRAWYSCSWCTTWDLRRAYLDRPIPPRNGSRWCNYSYHPTTGISYWCEKRSKFLKRGWAIGPRSRREYEWSMPTLAGVQIPQCRWGRWTKRHDIVGYCANERELRRL